MSMAYMPQVEELCNAAGADDNCIGRINHDKCDQAILAVSSDQLVVGHMMKIYTVGKQTLYHLSVALC